MTESPLPETVFCFEYVQSPVPYAFAVPVAATTPPTATAKAMAILPTVFFIQCPVPSSRITA
jgi:hypothetical protein